MEEKISFKERVKNEAINNVTEYKRVFVDYEYLICSEAYSAKYKIIKSDPNNYLHLIGVNTTLNANDFYSKCLSGMLEENDFDFVKANQDEKSVKGSVRQKIQVLKSIAYLFESELFTEENFRKNRVSCAFATSDNSYTMGFAVSGRPMSLMKSNELSSNAKKVDLIFRKPRNSKDKYTDLCFGDVDKIKKYKAAIEPLVSSEILKSDNE